MSLDHNMVSDIVVSIVVPIIAAFAAKIVRRYADEKQKERIVAIARGVYWIIEGVSKRTQMTADDKAAAALLRFTQELESEGYFVDKATEAKANQVWSAMAAKHRSQQHSEH